MAIVVSVLGSLAFIVALSFVMRAFNKPNVTVSRLWRVLGHVIVWHIAAVLVGQVDGLQFLALMLTWIYYAAVVRSVAVVADVGYLAVLMAIFFTFMGTAVMTLVFTMVLFIALSMLAVVVFANFPWVAHGLGIRLETDDGAGTETR